MALIAETLARVGLFTTLLHERRRGGRLWFRGPFGHGFEIAGLSATQAGRRLLLVGGGYGVAPLDFLAHRALVAGCRVTIAVEAPAPLTICSSFGASKTWTLNCS